MNLDWSQTLEEAGSCLNSGSTGENRSCASTTRQPRTLLSCGYAFLSGIFGSTAERGFAMKISGADGIQEKPQSKYLMNWKKFFFAFIAAFVVLFVFGFLWYGKLMQGAHQEVPALWRTETDFGNHFPVLVLGHLVMAFFLTDLFPSRAFHSGEQAWWPPAVLAHRLTSGKTFVLAAGLMFQ
jgi:hypothetical protein